jgi:hypothetical protein
MIENNPRFRLIKSKMAIEAAHIRMPRKSVQKIPHQDPLIGEPRARPSMRMAVGWVNPQIAPCADKQIATK